MRAQVPNPGYVLFPGSFVTLKVNLGELHDVFLVPQEAVLRDANGAFARIVGADGNVERRNLAIAAAQDSQWIVTSGIAAGDKVIVSGVQKVFFPGMPVQAKAVAMGASDAPAAAVAMK